MPEPLKDEFLTRRTFVGGAGGAGALFGSTSIFHALSGTARGIGSQQADVTSRLQSHIRFLSCACLGGRPTPSSEANIAGEYIASHFAAIGLSTCGTAAFKQDIDLLLETVSPTIGYEDLAITVCDTRIQCAPTSIQILNDRPFVFNNASAVLAIAGPDGTVNHTAHVHHTILVVPLKEWSSQQARLAWQHLRAIDAAQGPALTIIVVEDMPPELQPKSLVIDSDSKPPTSGPVLIVADRALVALLLSSESACTTLSVTYVHSPRRIGRHASAFNVIGKLDGHRDECIIVSAHYDHLESERSKAGERIVYPGANDNASGLGVLLEVARQLHRKKQPQYSILFIAYCGEEERHIGSRFYSRHPLVSIGQTICQLNLEQLGIASTSTKLLPLSLTGANLTNLGSFLDKVGSRSGVYLRRDSSRDSGMFLASDNEALAKLGVPAHTLCATYDYPQYHKPTDTFDIIELPSLVKITSFVVESILTLANGSFVPQWSSTSAATPFREAQARRSVY